MEKEKVSSGGIIIPDSVKEISHKAKVVAVGEGTYKGEKLIPPRVRPGDTILYKKFGAAITEIKGEEHLLIEEGHVVAVLEDE